MLKERGREMNNQRGSATVEAVVGFTAFLFAIFTILGLANFCRAQMLVSAAVDTAAKELSQYAYFYEMSGLQKFEGKLDNNAKVGKNNINQIIGTVDNLYSSINGAVDQTIQEKTNVANMLSAGDVDLQTFENSINNIENSAEGVAQGIAGVENALKDVGNDPLLYMRSIVALIGSETMEVAKRAVAVPLARAFVSKHFGSNRAEADANLKSLGIEGGLDSLNFNLSNIFSDDKHQDIEINVFYKVKLLQVFDFVVLEANVSKVAVCRAWLGGDDVIEKATVEKQPSLGTDAPPAEEAEPDESTDEGESDETETTESDDPKETTGTMNSTGNWALQHDSTGYYHSKRFEAFQDQFIEDYFIDSYAPGFYYRAKEGRTVAYDYSVFAKWEYEPYETIGGNKVDPGADRLLIDMEMAVKELATPQTNDDGNIQEFGAYTFIAYVPENIPDEQYSAMLEDANEARARMEEMIKNDTTGIPKDLKINVMIIKDGGEYDYNSNESDYVHLGGVE